jgi:hypothetical protein
LTRRLCPKYAAFNDHVPAVPGRFIESPAGAIMPTHDIQTTKVGAAPSQAKD